MTAMDYAKLGAKYNLFLPAPPVNAFGRDDARYKKLRRSLIAANELTLRALHLHHKPGAGELDIGEGYGAPVRMVALNHSPSSSALAGIV